MRIRAATNGPHESLRGKGVDTKIPRQRLGSSPEAGFPARGWVPRQRRGSPPEAGFPARSWVPRWRMGSPLRLTDPKQVSVHLLELDPGRSVPSYFSCQLLQHPPHIFQGRNIKVR